MAGNHGDWEAQLPSHAAHFRCITFDNRGIGLSAGALGAHDRSTFTMELMAGDIARLLDALDIPRAHILGASMGGVIAQAFALNYPDRLLTLSLHSTFARVSGKMRAELETEFYLLERLEVGDVLRSLAPMIWAERTLTARRYIIDNFRKTRSGKAIPVSKEVYALQDFAMMEIDYLSRLGGIEVPVLVTTGTDDGLVPPVESRLIHKAIPGSELHLFPGCGHAVTAENSRGFNTVSLRFLKKHSVGGGAGR
jgi:aminoacrylate hydrolase